MLHIDSESSMQQSVSPFDSCGWLGRKIGVQGGFSFEFMWFQVKLAKCHVDVATQQTIYSD